MKQRNQNPVVGDDIELRLFTFNSNASADVTEIEKVDIYYLDPAMVSAENSDGRRLVESHTDITQEDTGRYLITPSLIGPTYVIGKYLDIWHVKFESDEPATTIEQNFSIYPDLWITAPVPLIYDFSFRFRPNKITKGSKRYIIIEVTPNVPKSSDLEKYYNNLAIVSDLSISIEQACGDCMPQEQDLRLIVDAQPVDYREMKYGYYFLDTTDLDCGIYNIWFTLNLGTNIYVSEKNQLQIHS